MIQYICNKHTNKKHTTKIKINRKAGAGMESKT